MREETKRIEQEKLLMQKETAAKKADKEKASTSSASSSPTDTTVDSAARVDATMTKSQKKRQKAKEKKKNEPPSPTDSELLETEIQKNQASVIRREKISDASAISVAVEEIDLKLGQWDFSALD